MAEQKHLDWQYVTNQFSNALGMSYGDTNIFATDHLSKLRNAAGDVDIDRFIARIAPIYAHFQSTYTAWQKSTALWKGATLKTDVLLEDLFKTKLPKWDILIQVVYMADTEEYLTIFPQGRTAFREVGKDGKIQLLATMTSVLSDYPLLDTVRIDVEAFYQTLVAARDRQQQREQQVKDSSTNLRDAQNAVFIALYANLGGLMEKYAANTNPILNFYAIEMIRNIGQNKKNNAADTIQPIEDIEDDLN